jgi:hypothetical protein
MAGGERFASNRRLLALCGKGCLPKVIKIRAEIPRKRDAERFSLGVGKTPTYACRHRKRTDPLLPPPGHVLVRIYQGQRIEVCVLLRGFHSNGMKYRFLSAVAKAVTGSHCNGYAFFGLGKEGGDR